MASTPGLSGYLVQSAARSPRSTAVVDPAGTSLTYAELDALSDRLRDRLAALGVVRGDRVGMYFRKSVDSLAAIFGILKAQAAYVPVDPTAPASRNAYIFSNCGVRAVLVDAALADPLAAELEALDSRPTLLRIDFTAAECPLAALLANLAAEAPAPPAAAHDAQPDDLAYILYTSGSTGKPKGVMLSHRNATSFVDWCSSVFQPTADDRFSSHAPLHFDLSILDLYVPLKHGATLVLIGEALGKDPAKLAALAAEQKITCWYSTPSILSLLVQFGHLEKYDFSALRIVNFAGEVFPIKHLRATKQAWPRPRYFNLYGPTETNVCTYFEVPAAIPDQRSEPFPIGKVCAHARGRVVDEAGRDVPRGGEGELVIAGDGVMLGYWNAPEANARAFLTGPDGQRWYRTGDIVSEDAAGDYLFVGRRDRMVKKRGYRIELGEIEAGLYRHPAVKEAAAIALPDDESGVRIKAFLSGPGPRPSIIALKQFCAEVLPAYMIPDLFSWQDRLPKTSTDKIDYQRLKDLE